MKVMLVSDASPSRRSQCYDSCDLCGADADYECEFAYLCEDCAEDHKFQIHPLVVTQAELLMKYLENLGERRTLDEWREWSDQFANEIDDVLADVKEEVKEYVNG